MKSSGNDRLLLWAVAGLTGVVISSGAQPGGPAGGRAALRAPRAVLWGQHTGSLAWPHPQVLLSHLRILLLSAWLRTHQLYLCVQECAALGTPAMSSVLALPH
jgi:hypothetical protein